MRKKMYHRCICAGMAALFFIMSSFTVHAKAEEELELYAAAAVLMDGMSGRVLYGKNESEILAMASTTKIMTCILALEEGSPEQQVTFSSYAAGMPDVQLNGREGESFLLEDLLYSLMLESHNDTAVAIAEAIDGSVERFAERMNAKAAEIGCENTWFITPNGLDAEQTVNGELRFHSTTAQDLARIMKYCIVDSPEREQFLEITQTASYSFTDCSGVRSFQCSNHNAFLNMMEGALSGKTGYTGKAGYCYVGALERDGRTFIVALLACGWPNHKTYKWSDTRMLMEYGLEHYAYRNVLKTKELEPIAVQQGIPDNGELYGTAGTGLYVDHGAADELTVLLSEEEQITVQYQYPDFVKAPVQAGSQVGEVSYYLGELLLASYPIRISRSVGKVDFFWFFYQVIRLFLPG